MKIARPRGTRDFTAKEMLIRDHVRGDISKVFASFNYARINTPIFEHAELFEIKSGSEIREHMYVFKDKSGRNLCLRPEGTAPVCRMFASELKNVRKPLKLFYSGPMFRYERPQKGRYREFWHMGVELIGAKTVHADVEVIQLACECLDKLGIKYNVEIGHSGILRGLLNALGVDEDKQDQIMVLVDKGLTDEVNDIIKDKRLLEIIKFKGTTALTKTRKIIEGIDTDESLGPALEELEQIHAELERLGKRHEINLGIARGLTYYTGVVFEIRVDGLGAQNQICGGGRYDRLIKTLGGPKTPAVGFAFGFDRVVETLKHQGVEIPGKKQVILVAPVSENERNDACKIASMLRKQGFAIETDLLNRKLGSSLEYASGTGIGHVVIVGQKELKDDMAIVKDMESGKQSQVMIEKLGEFLTR